MGMYCNDHIVPAIQPLISKLQTVTRIKEYDKLHIPARCKVCEMQATFIMTYEP